MLGVWIGETEGAKFGLSAFTEIKNRGVEDYFVASIDGLQGLPETIDAVYPQAQLQPGIVPKNAARS